MRKKYFDMKLSQFSKYLNEIGILSGTDREKFQKHFYEISSDIYNSNDISSNDYNVNYIYFKETISNALLYFIKSLSEEKQKYIALNIFLKYCEKEDIIKEKLLIAIKIISNKYLKKYFHMWKINNIVLKNELKRTTSSNIISNLSNFNNQFEQKYNISVNENKDNNLTNDNTIDTNNNFCKNNLKANNSMANLNSQLLNISTMPDIYNNNYNNYSCYDNSAADQIINIYSNDRKHRPINLGELNNTYSINYYHPNDFFNHNINNNFNNFNFIQNYMNRTNYNKKYKYPERYTMNISNSTNNYNLSTSKSKDLSVSKIKHKVNIDYLSNLSKSKTEHNLIPEKTTIYIKEQEELEKYCTFKPKINKSSSFSNINNISNKKSIDRLYLDSKNRMARKEYQSLKKNNQDSKENTFQPKFISSSVKKIKTDFEQRLKNFEKKKKNNIKKLSSELDKEQKLQFTFSPKINEPLSNKRKDNSISIKNKNISQNQSAINKRKKIPAHKRLYNDNKDKKIRQELREREEIEKIKRNSSKTAEGINFNSKKIEELYNDYKIKKSRLKIKQILIEKEQGITFKPELISQKKYYQKINSDFYEREKKFLKKQQQNIDSYKLNVQNKENKRKKKYSEEEKKEIYSNIVSKLYKDGVEKYMRKINKNNDINDINYINYNNNEDEIKKKYIINFKNYKDESNISNINYIKNEFEYEQEPEEEVFNSNFGKKEAKKIF